MRLKLSSRTFRGRRVDLAIHLQRWMMGPSVRLFPESLSTSRRVLRHKAFANLVVEWKDHMRSHNENPEPWEEGIKRLKANDRTLKELDLDYSGISEEETMRLAKALRHNTYLEVLKLCGNGLTDDPIINLCECVAQSPRLPLEELELNFNFITKASSSALLKLLMRQGLTVNLFGNDGEDEIERLKEKSAERWKDPIRRLDRKSVV